MSVKCGRFFCSLSLFHLFNFIAFFSFFCKWSWSVIYEISSLHDKWIVCVLYCQFRRESEYLLYAYVRTLACLYEYFCMSLFVSTSIFTLSTQKQSHHSISYLITSVEMVKITKANAIKMFMRWSIAFVF